MSDRYCSIFNDALGPVMTGPSSSHSAGCNRIGQVARSLFGKEIRKADIVFEEKGSYPSTYLGQGSNFGFISGLLGYDTDDRKLKDAAAIAKDLHMDITFLSAPLGFLHPNQAEVRIYDESGDIALSVMTFSVGGGMFRITELNGFDVMIDGSRDQYFIFTDSESAGAVLDLLDADGYETACSTNRTGSLITVSMKEGQSADTLYALRDTFPSVSDIRYSKAVLPVIKNDTKKPPFFNAAEALAYSGGTGEAWELAVEYETGYGQISEETIKNRIRRIREVMEESTVPPDPGTTPLYGFLPYSSKNMSERSGRTSLIDAGILNRAMTAAVSVMENSCAHNIIVAAPTAGSSGVVPASIVTLGREMGKSDDEIDKALLTAGLTGVFIANQATFAGETGACQAENGSASAMAAAGIVTLLGGSAEESFRAASLALQNMLGLICDPVAGLTEIPCVSRNVSSTANAVMSANMVMLGFDPVIPLDETIETMGRVGQAIPDELCCTCGGGLCTTPTGCRIQNEIDVRRKNMK